MDGRSYALHMPIAGPPQTARVRPSHLASPGLASLRFASPAPPPVPAALPLRARFFKLAPSAPRSPCSNFPPHRPLWRQIQSRADGLKSEERRAGRWEVAASRGFVLTRITSDQTSEKCDSFMHIKLTQKTISIFNH